MAETHETKQDTSTSCVGQSRPCGLGGVWWSSAKCVGAEEGGIPHGTVEGLANSSWQGTSELEALLVPFPQRKLSSEKQGDLAKSTQLVRREVRLASKFVCFQSQSCLSVSFLGNQVSPRVWENRGPWSTAKKEACEGQCKGSGGSKPSSVPILCPEV